MKTHLRKLWDSLKSSYWFIPLVMMALAVLLWRGTATLDHVLSFSDKKDIAWLYISDADSMRALLLTIAVAIIGVVGVVFTIIMIPLSIAAAQFGPRLLRNFLRDTGTQVTLGTFNATFIFCMAVLLQLSNSGKNHLPQISVNMALLLGLVSFGVLIYFINHVAVSIQAPVLVAKVSRELQAAIRHELHDKPDTSSIKKQQNKAPDFSAAHSIIPAVTSGYLQARDDEELLRLAVKHNLVISIEKNPGDFIVEQSTLIFTWPETDTDSILKPVNAAFIIGVQRTLVQDITFGINELAEVAIRALSPAINDPFTAMTCLDWIGSALCSVCRKTFDEAEIYDDKGNLRIVRTVITFADLTNAAFNQIREYGNTSTAVTLRLMNTLKVVAPCTVTDEQRKALWRHATMVERCCHFGLHEENDRKLITDQFEMVKKILKA
ncbi:MAG: DUF2254 domain-containing protein [Bacteroidota bacterium]|nr:DUF2254 domain-containing protein [Bacteroidota bacterium]